MHMLASGHPHDKRRSPPALKRVTDSTAELAVLVHPPGAIARTMP
jgi:hypothetical protein